MPRKKISKVPLDEIVEACPSSTVLCSGINDDCFQRWCRNLGYSEYDRASRKYLHDIVTANVHGICERIQVKFGESKVSQSVSVIEEAVVEKENQCKLDMSQWILAQQSQNLLFESDSSNHENVYDLIAVANHYGRLNFGHYTTTLKHEPLGQWFEFDDESVTFVRNENALVTSFAYLLVYQRRSSNV